MCKNHREKLSVGDGVLAVLIIALIVAECVTVSAQQRVTPALALARICVSEANWECFDRRDGYAIHEVILRGVERHHTTYVGFARAYAGATLGARAYPASARRQWPAELDESGSTPPHWPSTPRFQTMRDGRVRLLTPLPWSNFKDRWLRVLAEAREVIQHTLLDVRRWSPCDGPVEDWGGDMDRHRAVRLGLIPVSCGDTANDFYRRP